MTAPATPVWRSTAAGRTVARAALRHRGHALRPLALAGPGALPRLPGPPASLVGPVDLDRLGAAVAALETGAAPTTSRPPAAGRRARPPAGVSEGDVAGGRSRTTPPPVARGVTAVGPLPATPGTPPGVPAPGGTTWAGGTAARPRRPAEPGHAPSSGPASVVGPVARSAGAARPPAVVRTPTRVLSDATDLPGAGAARDAAALPGAAAPRAGAADGHARVTSDALRALGDHFDRLDRGPDGPAPTTPSPLPAVGALADLLDRWSGPPSPSTAPLAGAADDRPPADPAPGSVRGAPWDRRPQRDAGDGPDQWARLTSSAPGSPGPATAPAEEVVEAVLETLLRRDLERHGIDAEPA